MQPPSPCSAVPPAPGGAGCRPRAPARPQRSPAAKAAPAKPAAAAVTAAKPTPAASPPAAHAAPASAAACSAGTTAWQAVGQGTWGAAAGSAGAGRYCTAQDLRPPPPGLRTRHAAPTPREGDPVAMRSSGRGKQRSMRAGRGAPGEGAPLGRGKKRSMGRSFMGSM